MPRPRLHEDTLAPVFIPGPRTRYVVVRREGIWFINFEGEEYGPYASEREALLFAVDAAHKLDEKGEDTEVLVTDEAGDAQLMWTSGQDPYPPRLL